MEEATGPNTGGGVGSGSAFQPKEDLVTVLQTLGFSRNAATRALYYTGNSNADLAASWLLENQEHEGINAPLNLELEGSDDSDEELDIEEGDMCKMVFVVNSELNMGIGKIAAQTAHAALGVYRIIIDDQKAFGQKLLAWETLGETKIVLKGENATQLTELAAKAKLLNLPYYVVQDAGRTQVESGSITVVGIMGKISEVDSVTGHLKLL